MKNTFECPSEINDEWQASDRNSGRTLRQAVGSMEFIEELLMAWIDSMAGPLRVQTPTLGINSIV